MKMQYYYHLFTNLKKLQLNALNFGKYINKKNKLHLPNKIFYFDRYHANGKHLKNFVIYILLILVLTGEDVGTFRVLKLEKGSLNPQILFSISGNQGNEW